MPRLQRLPLIATGLALALAACGGERARAPGEVSEGEAKALEEAASMLDQRRLPPEALPPEAAPEPAPEPGPQPADAEMTGDTAQPSGE